MIQDSINRISYDGNGIATEFAYPFTIITISDIKVMIVDTDGTETVLTNDYYVDEVNSKVDYPGYPEGEEPLPENQPPILATGQKIVIYRELSVTQLTSLFDQYPFKTIEAMIDKTTILLQQLKDAQERALTLSVSTDTAVSLILPAPSALKSFRWNSSANKLELTADPATVLASVQGYTEQAEGYATSANEDAETATTGANTATSQAEIATQAAATMTLATQAEAEAGTDNVHYMSALRTLQTIKANIDIYHPIGSIYMSVVDTSPATLFGGTWMKIEEMFLLAAGATHLAGDTGGEATHTLTIDEIPNHSHSIYGDKISNIGSFNSIAANQGISNFKQWYSSATGGGLAHNNMPPYLAVYMWKRTA